jgi:carboxypeptidase family protein
MTMRPLLLALAVSCFIAACGGSSAPNTPTPINATWNLNGTVRSSAGANINAATVAILDGPDAGKQATADTSGRYGFTGLREGGFSVRVSADGYTAVTQGVTLTANRVVDFQLSRVPVAELSFGDELDFTARPDGGFDIFASGVNSGDGCATSISGVTTITGSSGVVLTFPWTLPPATIVRPGERFRYTFGPISRADLTRLGSGNRYTTRADFTSSACQ